MTAVQQAPSGLDADPSAYLALPRFNNILAFSFDLAGTAYPSTISYALTFAPPAGAWPVLVFFNGLGGHRLVAALFEGIAREHRVQILVLDKPSGPLCQSFAPTAPTTPLPLPLALRTRWAHAALLAVLAHHRIARFAALSHSNGVFYALHTLLHLPPGLTPTGWALTGLFIPPSISGSAALRLAAALPHALPNGLGALLQVVPPLASVAGWSGGVWAASAGLLSAAPAPDDAAHRPPHKRGYLARSVSDACRTATMRVGLREGRAVMGQEALLCLHGAEPAGAHGDAGADGGSDARVKHESVWGVGPGGDDAAVLRGAFARLAERYGGGGGMPVWVTYGAADGMVPAKGRAWLHAELEGVGLLRQGDDAAWTEVPEAGHDDVLFVDAVVGGILGRVARQA
ncbi:hypothetical protein B0H15DRAFT_947538 [Mycena belliarum]|uniref:Uncharacterized protein n=1 Tax=Mycena belliarum TaxID=1033014 RepID=A0AAD6UC72_9AGAR|nr:hypothetical protein B0H15DRAFT_947538 [Mycena belliae]